MNDQFFELDEIDNEEELLAFDQEGEAGDFETDSMRRNSAERARSARSRWPRSC